MRFSTTKIKHYCPNCSTLLKKEVKDDSLNFLCIVLFIPIGLIVLIAKLINKTTKPKKVVTVFGEEVVRCPNCNQYIAITSYPNFPRSRVLSSDEMNSLGINPYKESAPPKNCSNCKYDINEIRCEIWNKKPDGACDEFRTRHNSNRKNGKKDFINF